jgi:hypothetical protein
MNTEITFALQKEYFDDAYSALEFIFGRDLSENYLVLPNVNEVNQILIKHKTKIICCGDKWLVAMMDDKYDSNSKLKLINLLLRKNLYPIPDHNIKYSDYWC